MICLSIDLTARKGHLRLLTASLQRLLKVEVGIPSLLAASDCGMSKYWVMSKYWPPLPLAGFWATAVHVEVGVSCLALNSDILGKPLLFCPGESGLELERGGEPGW